MATMIKGIFFQSLSVSLFLVYLYTTGTLFRTAAYHKTSEMANKGVHTWMFYGNSTRSFYNTTFPFSQAPSSSTSSKSNVPPVTAHGVQVLDLDDNFLAHELESKSNETDTTKRSPVAPEVSAPSAPEQLESNNTKTSTLLDNQVRPNNQTHTTDVLELPDDFTPNVYRGGNWDNSPIVVEEYKLLFFTQGKVACTEFKKLLRRMMHFDDWMVHREPHIPHDPRHNGLKYLYHYPLEEAREMLTDDQWTRAIFVRDPKERFLSAYLDKATKKGGLYVYRHCCFNRTHGNSVPPNSCGERASRSVKDFLSVVQGSCCCDPHWKPQSSRIDKELWPFVNFFGYFQSMADHSKSLLERLNVWEQFGASGWGTFQNESIFSEASTSKHKTSAQSKVAQYFNESHVEVMVEQFYSDDYDLFNFTRRAGTTTR